MKQRHKSAQNRRVRSHDVHSPQQRSFNMSRIRGAHTRPEVALRKALWKRGIRYRLKTSVAGKPDLVLPHWGAVVFVDGCFWHVCPKHVIWPRTNAEFWREKLTLNVRRDKLVSRQLKRAGWLVIRVWEHDVRSDVERCAERIMKKLAVSRTRSLGTGYPPRK